ncbi:glycosyltransferase family 4 protein [Sulfurovum sp. CS9]|uniref:glycosyltransferase family 4 protein n=1 Tax=Sulfurovum sp. CS9 TaxID=3391146 RepID=UPI0039ED5DE9
MKIGIVTTWFERGAAYVSKQYEELLEDEHEVYIYARGGETYAEEDSKWNTANVYWAKKYTMPITGTYIDEEDFKKWIERNQIETILFNEQSWWQSVVLCKKWGIKTGAYIDYYTDRTLELFNAYDFLICNTKRHYSAFSWHKQCYYIPWGTDTSLFAPKVIDEEKKNKNDNFVFFHSAGMSPFRKGTDFVIEAFAKISDRYPESTLIIHSQSSLEKTLPMHVKLMNNLIQKNKLEIIEETVTAPGLYYKGDVYVYPSRLEGIGLTIAEAQSSGLPIITVDNAPMNEFIVEPSKAASVKKYYCRGDGYYWPMCEVNVDDLAKQMEYFLNNKDKLQEYKNKTREYATKNLDWMGNKDGVEKAFVESELLLLEKNTVNLINKYDNLSFPLITKYPLVYSYSYRFFKYMKGIFA